jgi:molecular chaperone HscA
MANIGIDLGTTHSLVAVVMGGKARCLLDDEGRGLTPSAVRFTDARLPDGSAAPPLIGWDALEDAAEHASTTITSAKRFMGRSLDEARQVAHELHYELAEDSDGDRVVRMQVGDKTTTPVEVSAWILRLLFMRAADCLLSQPGGAVITVPAYFDDAQRQATRDAGKLAGLNVLRLLNEPTAAAIAYGLQDKKEGVFAVFDLGGGTFDVSILELTEGVFQVLSTAGDTRLGGDDLDRLVAEQILERAGIQGASGGVLRAAMEAGEAAKIALSDAESTRIQLELDGNAVDWTLTRAEFEALIGPTVQRTLTSCARAISDAELEAGDMDGVVLVGGSTRVPLVKRVVAEFFGQEPLCDIDPDRVVALGAAMQADILTGSSELADDLLLMDVVPLSLGLETMGGVVERLIWRCSPIPVTASETFTTQVDGQTGVDIHVLQGERELARDNRSLAKFKLSGLPDMPAGLPRVKVTFTVDADGILSVSAEEQYTSTAAQVEVQPSYGLEDAEIERMLEEAIDHAESDVDERLLIEARVEAEGVIAAVSKALDRDAPLLQGNEGEVIGQVRDALTGVLSGADRHRIQDLTKKLDEVTAPFAQRRIERDLKQALEGQDAIQVFDALDRTVNASDTLA